MINLLKPIHSQTAAGRHYQPNLTGAARRRTNVRILLCTVAAALIPFGGSGQANSANTKDPVSQTRVDKQKSTRKVEKGRTAMSTEGQGPDLKAAIQAASPGPIHQYLAKFVGEYTISTKFQSPGGGSPPESIGAARISTALDGRFLVEENSGSLMGQPFRGMRMLGYNNEAKRYEAVWTYTMSTAMLILNGNGTDDGRKIQMSGALEENGVKKTLYVVIRFVDDDRFVVELRNTAPGNDSEPFLETTYTRKR